MFKVTIDKIYGNKERSMHATDTYEMRYHTGKTEQITSTPSHARLLSQFEEYVLRLSQKKQEVEVVFNDTLPDKEIGELVESFKVISLKTKKELHYVLPEKTIS